VLGGYPKCLRVPSGYYPVIPIWNFQGITFKDTLIEPLITSSDLYEKNQMNENWIQKNKFKYWDPRDKTLYLGQVLKIQCTRFQLIIVVVLLGAVKTHVAIVEALRKKGKTGWNLVLWVSTPLNANVLPFCKMFFESHLMYDQTQGSFRCCIFLILWILMIF
jgi:hypothetical protein